MEKEITTKLAIKKKLFEYDVKVGKDLLGTFYSDITYKKLPKEFKKYYEVKANEIIKMVKELDD